MSYTIYVKSGIIRKNSDNTQILPGRSSDDPLFIEYKNWLLDGNQLIEDNSDPEENRIQHAKQTREEQIKYLRITVDGMEFDADEKSQERISRAITGLQFLGKIKWVLADNTVALVSREQLQQVLINAIEATTNIWTAPYDL